MVAQGSRDRSPPAQLVRPRLAHAAPCSPPRFAPHPPSTWVRAVQPVHEPNWSLSTFLSCQPARSFRPFPSLSKVSFLVKRNPSTPMWGPWGPVARREHCGPVQLSVQGWVSRRKLANRSSRCRRQPHINGAGRVSPLKAAAPVRHHVVGTVSKVL